MNGRIEEFGQRQRGRHRLRIEDAMHMAAVNPNSADSPYAR
jgi:hypothetical protein